MAQSILDFLTNGENQAPSQDTVQGILSQRFEPDFNDVGNAALTGISNNSYVNPQNYADQRMQEAIKKLQIIAQMQKQSEANLPQGYRMNSQTGQAELIPGVDSSFGKKADPFAMPVAVYDPVTGQQKFVQKNQVTNFQPPTADPNSKPMTESQGKASLFASRMAQSEPILDSLGNKVGTDPSQRGKASIPLIGNYLVSSDYQQLDQAERNFVNATLRQESGAAINQSEFDNAVKQYFPRPGDGPQVIEQKRQNRALAIQQMQQQSTGRSPQADTIQGGDTSKTIIKTQISPSTGKRKIIYSDGTEEIQ